MNCLTNRNEFVKIRKKRNWEFVVGSAEQDNFHDNPSPDLVRIEKRKCSPDPKSFLRTNQTAFVQIRKKRNS